MIKKIVLLAFASIMAVSSVASAAPNKKKIKVTNESSVGYYYKVGGKTIYIAPGSSKSFSVDKRKKSVSIQASTSKTGGFKNVATLNNVDTKSGIKVNPAKDQYTPVNN